MLTHVGRRETRVITTSGEIRINRSVLYDRMDKTTEIPTDEYIEIKDLPFKITKAMMTDTAFYGQNEGSFEKAGVMIKKSMNIDISKETIREVTEYVGKKVYEEDTKRGAEIIINTEGLEISRDQVDTLYIMIDGAAVNTRIEDENGSTWRENKLVIAFRSKDIIQRGNGDSLILKKEYMSYIGSAEEFRKYVMDIAVRNGYKNTKNVVVIADGATWIRNLCEEILPDAVQILDKFHLCENIYTYAKQLFNNVDSLYVPWAESVINKIENGQIEEALKLIPENEKKAAGVFNLKGYIQNNIDKINYPLYKDQGFFIGSGAIESGNKTVVHRRLKQAGMRWSVDGAQYVLTLRTKAESNLWNKHVREFICASCAA